MNDKAGKLGSGFVWLFALGAIVLGIGGAYATASLGAKVSSGVFFGVFAVAGFLAAFLTKAGKGIATLAFLLASFTVSGTYYAIVQSAVSSAGGGGSEVGTLGAAMGIFVAFIALVTTLAAGIGGVVFGARTKAQLQQSPPLRG